MPERQLLFALKTRLSPRAGERLATKSEGKKFFRDTQPKVLKVLEIFNLVGAYEMASGVGKCVSCSATRGSVWCRRRCERRMPMLTPKRFVRSIKEECLDREIEETAPGNQILATIRVAVKTSRQG